MISKDHEFSSERLAYRGISEADAMLIVGWRSNPQNYRWFKNRSPITLESHLAWYRSYLDDPTRFDYLILDPSGIPIGTAGLSNINGESCEVNYMIGDEAARGHGYASEALRSMCELAFRELGIHRVEARILPGNEASVRTALSAGLSERERVFAKEKDA